MGCIQSLIWKSASGECECPDHISFENLSVKPEHRTPLDKLGFPQRCCWCCSLRVASIFICIISLIWGAIEFQTTDIAIGAVFPDRGVVFKCCKTMYLLICLVFILTCGGLMLGIIIRNEKPIFVYVWSAFVFNCIVILLTISTTVAGVVAKGTMEARQTVKTVFKLTWCIIFFYLLMVVNSYKLAVCAKVTLALSVSTNCSWSPWAVIGKATPRLITYLYLFLANSLFLFFRSSVSTM